MARRRGSRIKPVAFASLQQETRARGEESRAKKLVQLRTHERIHFTVRLEKAEEEEDGVVRKRMATTAPLVTLVARNVDPRRCPFANAEVRLELREGECVHLRGGTGIGKTTISGTLAGLTASSRLSSLGMEVDVRWREDVPPRERVGALFQTTTLVDSLSVGGNVAAALALSGRLLTTGRGDAAIAIEARRLVEAVGLDWERDGGKMPGELSGGMARRASLALQLAQAKRVIVLDEPFTGLDGSAGAAIAAELVALRRKQGTALLLVSHQPDLVALVHDARRDAIVQLHPSERVASEDGSGASRGSQDANRPKPARAPNLGAHRFGARLRARLADYCLLSLPLIMLAFAAAGLAVSALLADLLVRVDVHR